MGKNSVIKSLARVIGNVGFHKFLFEHTNQPEAKNHLRYEIIEYSADALEKTQEFNWNDNDKIKIKEKSLERAKNISENYPDLVFNWDEIERIIEDFIEELGLC